MRLLNLKKIKEGMIVGRPVIDGDGRILLNGGKTITPVYIKASEAKGCTSIYITDDIDGDDDLNTATRSKAIHAIHGVFDAIEHYASNLKERSIGDLAEAISWEDIKALMAPGGTFDDINASANEIMGEGLTRNTLAGLTAIKSVDSKLYHHLLDVCVVAVMIAQSIGLRARETQQLAVGCLLYNIGELFLDHAASELSKVRQHTRLVPVFPLGIEILIRGETYRNHRGIVKKSTPATSMAQPLYSFKTIKKSQSLQLNLTSWNTPKS